MSSGHNFKQISLHRTTGQKPGWSKRKWHQRDALKLTLDNLSWLSITVIMHHKSAEKVEIIKLFFVSKIQYKFKED